MAIIKENLKSKTGKRYIKLFSDKNFYIRNCTQNALYHQVITVPPVFDRYEETDIPLPESEESKKEEITKEE